MIAASIWLAPHLEAPIYALAIGVVVGGVLQLAVQFAALARMGLKPRISFRLRTAWADPTVKRIMRQMLPATLGVSVAQLSLLINTNIATWLAPGSVSWLSFADRLMEFPTALLGAALSTVLLPSLSHAHAAGRTDDYSALLDWGLRLTLLLGLPAGLGLALMSQGLVATLFHYGAFTASDVSQTQLAVMAYAVGLIGLLSVKILAPGFYARQDIRTPVKIALVVLVATQCLNLVFVPRFHHAGLALSIGFGACLNALALLIGLRRLGVYRPAAGWYLFMFKLLVALAVMGGALWFANAKVDWLGMQSHAWLRVSALLGLIGGACVLYFVTLFLLGFRPHEFRKRADHVAA
jgi:putative peptidoglycan lipid II flippase